VRSPFRRSLTLALLAAASLARAACDLPRCSDVVIPVPRRLHVPDPRVRVLLPAGYGASRARYPVLYLLHGAGDTYTAWTEKTDVQALSEAFPVVIVMPDSGHDAEAGFYSDWVDGSRQWETFHTRTLLKYIDHHFRTRRGRKHRAVAGLSMGGFGAMSYAARHHRLFSAAASFSGAVDTLYPAPATPIVFGLRIVAPGIWGDPVTNEAIWREHNPTDLAADLADTTLFVATGDGTTGGPAGDVSEPLAYAIERIVFDMSHRFVDALDANGVPHVDDFYGGGYHGWPYWERELHWVLPQIMDVINREGR
jgi:S-formylglutathione hydrolase FrmB